MNRFSCLSLALLLGTAVDAQARLVQTTPQGLEVSETMTIAAPPSQIYAALGAVEQWWNPAHTFSGSAANLKLDLHPGGCFCETLKDGGFVEHLTVVYAVPGQLLRMRGALGPFQAEGVEGALTWTIKESPGGATVTETYVVGGYFRGGYAQIAPKADAMLADVAQRFKAFVETGRQDKAKP